MVATTATAMMTTTDSKYPLNELTKPVKIGHT